MGGVPGASPGGVRADCVEGVILKLAYPLERGGVAEGARVSHLGHSGGCSEVTGHRQATEG